MTTIKRRKRQKFAYRILAGIELQRVPRATSVACTDTDSV